jgi:hypothetical protein
MRRYHFKVLLLSMGVVLGFGSAAFHFAHRAQHGHGYFGHHCEHQHEHGRPWDRRDERGDPPKPAAEDSRPSPEP